MCASVRNDAHRCVIGAIEAASGRAGADAGLSLAHRNPGWPSDFAEFRGGDGDSMTSVGASMPQRALDQHRHTAPRRPGESVGERREPRRERPDGRGRQRRRHGGMQIRPSHVVRKML